MRLWIPFAPYAVAAAVHVGAQAVGAAAIETPTKLLLMPALALGVVLASRGRLRSIPTLLLLAAIALSWIGDGAGTFFPFLPELPVMLVFFGLAHLCYIRLFWRHLAVRRVPPWAVVYALWWGVLVAVLWPHLGALSIAVAVYGLVLGGTAVAATRCHPLVVWGSVFFLTSDSILAFHLFLPEVVPDGPWVMLTYTIGQGLIAAGAVTALRLAAAREPEPLETTV